MYKHYRDTVQKLQKHETPTSSDCILVTKGRPEQYTVFRLRMILYD